MTTTETYLLLELFVDGIHGVLECDTLHVAGSHRETAGPDKIDLLEWWGAQRNFEKVWVLDRGRVGVDLPVI